MGVDPDVGAEPAPASGRGPDERLDDRIVRLIQEQSGHVSFNGLRRSLSAHPESLTRALRRLERFGVLLHDEAGYAMADGPGTEFEAGVRPEFHQIGEVELPAGSSTPWVLGQFAGRWFRDLRWIGMIEGRGEPWLIWTVPGSEGHVFLTLNGRRLRVGTDRAAAGRSERVESAARSLLATGLDRLGRRPAPVLSGVRLFARAGVPAHAVPN
ncbi:MAG TPA: hypothetical protein VN842_06390 [Thermoplasmata archaeon]|nr:hypothetical protein [Thermoplasmata archaeon]